MQSILLWPLAGLDIPIISQTFLLKLKIDIVITYFQKEIRKD